MPVRTGTDSDGCYAQWGESGTKYHYECGNDEARKRAKRKAAKQGQAAHASGYEGAEKFLEGSALDFREDT